MAPKKAATQYLIRATAEGEWSAGESARGEFRISVDTDLAQVNIHVGPGYLEDWNPVPMKSYSFRYLRGGSHLRIAFQLLPLQWQGEIEINVSGGLAGKFESPDGPGKVTGVGKAEEVREYMNEIPKPALSLAQKLQKEPSSVKWQVPAALSEGTVMLVGLGGPSKSGKSVLAAALADRIGEQGRRVAVVEQSRFEFCVGQYNCSAGVNESMFENPSAVNWPDLVKSISKAVEQVAAEGTPEAPSFVLLEGTLVFHMPQICQAMRRRILLRCSRNEVLRRRQASATLAEPFAEHVFWPMHLQYGQPQAEWEEIRVEDGEEGHPAPEALVSEALGLLGTGLRATSQEPAAEASDLASDEPQSAGADVAQQAPA